MGPERCGFLINAKSVRKLNKNVLNDKSVCFDMPIRELIDNDLVLAKSVWLQRTEGLSSAIAFLLEVIDYGYENSGIHLQLAKNYFQDNKWQAAKDHLEQVYTDLDSPIIQLLNYRLGNHVENPESLPLIYTQDVIKQAKVKQQTSVNTFDLQMISDGNANKINGEPSIITSNAGNQVWVLWTDSGESEAILPDYYYWDIKSVQSIDGGLNWTNIDMDTTPGKIDRFHFDPMTAYDENNEIMYAGGMVNAFTSNEDDSFFIYRWDLVGDVNTGPYRHTLLGPDKGLIAVDNDGDILISHHQGIDYSTDFGESFSSISNQDYVAPHPRFNSSNCLIITDMEKSSYCSNNGIQTQPQNFSSLSFFDEVGEFIPGSFRVYAIVQNTITSDDTIYAVYTDLRQGSNTDTTIYMTQSSDNGQNWSAPWQISPTITGDQFLPWIEVDNNNGLHVIYFDTRNVTQSDDSDVATLDVYYSYSDDLGQSWTETRVTPASFTTPDLIWGDYFFTDYISMSLSNDQVYLAFPWSEQPNQMHMYVASKSLVLNDLIFMNGFD